MPNDGMSGLLHNPWISDQLRSILREEQGADGTPLVSSPKIVQCIAADDSLSLVVITDTQISIPGILTPAARTEFARRYRGRSFANLAGATLKLESWHFSTVALCACNPEPAKGLRGPLCLQVGGVEVVGPQNASTRGNPVDVNNWPPVRDALQPARRQHLLAILARRQGMQALPDAEGVPSRAEPWTDGRNPMVPEPDEADGGNGGTPRGGARATNSPKSGSGSRVAAAATAVAAAFGGVLRGAVGIGRWAVTPHNDDDDDNADDDDEDGEFETQEPTQNMFASQLAYELTDLPTQDEGGGAENGGGGCGGDGGSSSSGGGGGNASSSAEGHAGSAHEGVEGEGDGNGGGFDRRAVARWHGGGGAVAAGAEEDEKEVENERNESSRWLTQQWQADGDSAPQSAPELEPLGSDEEGRGDDDDQETLPEYMPEPAEAAGDAAAESRGMGAGMDPAAAASGGCGGGGCAASGFCAAGEAAADGGNGGGESPSQRLGSLDWQENRQPGATGYLGAASQHGAGGVAAAHEAAAGPGVAAAAASPAAAVAAAGAPAATPAAAFFRLSQHPTPPLQLQLSATQQPRLRAVAAGRLAPQPLSSRLTNVDPRFTTGYFAEWLDNDPYAERTRQIVANGRHGSLREFFAGTPAPPPGSGCRMPAWLVGPPQPPAGSAPRAAAVAAAGTGGPLQSPVFENWLNAASQPQNDPPPAAAAGWAATPGSANCERVGKRSAPVGSPDGSFQGSAKRPDISEDSGNAEEGHPPAAPQSGVV
ncbi:unnamed protein product [Phaeothamnion confervicola]